VVDVRDDGKIADEFVIHGYLSLSRNLKTTIAYTKKEFDHDS